MGVRVLLKRDDLIHPEIPGNKWRKLKYNVEAARGVGTLLTFGGTYSNHIRATAAVGYYNGFDTIGVIRGEEHLPLAYAVQRGMRLTYLDRTSYRAKTSAAVIDGLHREFGDFYLLPEGGSNKAAGRGCAELPAEITEPFDVLFTTVGTGGTLAGVAAGLHPGQAAVGVPVLKASSKTTWPRYSGRRRASVSAVGTWNPTTPSAATRSAPPNWTPSSTTSSQDTVSASTGSTRQK